MSRSDCPCRPNASSSASMRAIRSRLGRELVLARRDEKLRVSRTVSDPMSASSCSTKQLICRKAALDGLDPLTKTVPSTFWLAIGRDASVVRRVVLPHPDGPMNAQISPVRFGQPIDLLSDGNMRQRKMARSYLL